MMVKKIFHEKSTGSYSLFPPTCAKKSPDQGKERSRPIWQVRQLEAAGSIPLPPFFAFLHEIKKIFLQKYSSWCKKFLHFFIFWIFVSKTWYLNDLRSEKSPNLTILKMFIWHYFFTENRKISLYTLFSRARNRLETFLEPLFYVKTLYFDQNISTIYFSLKYNVLT